MEENTVVEVNRVQLNDENIFKINIEDVESSKDYVVDQIFCGENITVYALFEISDNTNKKVDKQLVELSKSSLNHGYRVYHTNSLKKDLNEDACDKLKISVETSCENDSLKNKNQIKKIESICNLTHFLDNYDVSRQKQGSSEMKILFSKEMSCKNHGNATFEVVSTGVNTDIVQSPKLVEKIQRVASLNFPISKHRKSTELTYKTSLIPSYEIIEIETRPSYSSCSSDLGNVKFSEKISQNFLFVPLFLMEEETLNRFKEEEVAEEVIVERKVAVDEKVVAKEVVEKEAVEENNNVKNIKKENCAVETKISTVSMGVNTSTDDLLKKNQKKSDKSIQSKLSRSSEIQVIYNEKKHTSTNKKSILEEVKNLQLQLNALIKSLECSESQLNRKSDDFTFQIQKNPTSSNAQKDIFNVESDRISQNLFARNHPVRRSFKMCDDLQNFSSLRHLPSKDLSQNISRIALNTDSRLQTEILLTSPKVGNCPRSKGLGVSKSQSNNYSVFPECIKQIHFIKRSLSLEEKSDSISNKRVKNVSLKIEGNLKFKSSARKYQDLENCLVSEASVLNSEMGDKVSVNPKILIGQQPIKQNLSFGDDINPKPKSEILEVKTKAENEEGDAKIFFDKGCLTQQESLEKNEKVTAHYCCHAITTLSEGMLKNERGAVKSKCKTIDKNVEKVTKTTVNEKSSNFNRNQRRVSISDFSPKKEIEVNRNIESKNKTQDLERKDKISKKPKFMFNKNSFIKTLPEGRQIEKNIKKIDAEVKLGNVAFNKSSFIAQPIKATVDNKFRGKCDQLKLLPRSPSQKRERRESGSTILQSDREESTSQVATLRKGKNIQRVFEKTVIKESSKQVRLAVNNKSSTTATENRHLENSKNMYTNTPTSVVLDFLSNKPESLAKVNVANRNSGGNIALRGCSNCERNMKRVNKKEDSEKSAVKSVWALTKLLLYEDGSKKFEVLEASLSPPEYNFNNEKV